MFFHPAPPWQPRRKGTFSSSSQGDIFKKSRQCGVSRFDTLPFPVILPRSDGGAYQPFGQIITRWLLYLIYETTIPALKTTAEAPARVLEPQFKQERPRHPPESAPRWAQTPDAGLIPAWGPIRQAGCAWAARVASKKGATRTGKHTPE